MAALIAVGRRLLITVGLACTAAAGVAGADSTVRGPFAVWAIGLSDGYVTMESQNKVIRVTAEDVARGEVRVYGGSRIVIETSAGGGYVLEFMGRRGPMRAVQVGGYAGVFDLSPMNLKTAVASTCSASKAVGFARPAS